MRAIAIANQKGGVGKTTTAVNLATALAASGKRVIIIDFDPQGNASTGFGIPRDKRSPSSYEILFDPLLAGSAAQETLVPGLMIVPAIEGLAGAEVELVGEPNAAGRLKAAFQRLPACDYIFIDCPPSLSLLTLNALVAADGVLIPLQTEFYAMEGLSQLLKTVEQVRARQNPKLDIEGVVLTMHDRRNRLSDMVAADVRAALGARVFETMIPRNVRLSEAPSHGLPALLYDMRCPGSEAYMALAREMIAQPARAA
ncbi:ParA family protein [Sandaracinobacteroides sayramensis]|uniref:ParA family protein n=1 Tax=Sandaracinobacteroides sayramensis TaxID=2913411 RepID=UPI0021050080|nr:AAA family ATPase [Sandaracinobacteroides sayramensis]